MTRAAAILVLLACLWYFPLPAEPTFRVCGFHWLTGRNCPFCGLTRAFFALAKGHWGEAVGFNALSPLAFLMCLTLFWKSPVRGRVWASGLAAFGIYGVVRILIPSA